MKRLRLRLEFDGGPFAGWQLQSEGPDYTGKPTVQASVERAIATLLHRPGERIPVQGCGRTDAGVHAREFFAHFDLPDDSAVTDLERLRHSLNCLLPDGIVVTHCAAVAANFHALKNVESKVYEYRVLLRRAKPTWQRQHCWWLPLDPSDSTQFDCTRLAAALNDLQGTHDFVAFAAANFSAKTSVRTLNSCRYTLTPLHADLSSGMELLLSFEGSGFLKQMVRNMVGTLVEIARGQREVAAIGVLLGAAGCAPARRQDAGYCAPPQGLFLKSVKYNQ